MINVDLPRLLMFPETKWSRDRWKASEERLQIQGRRLIPTSHEWTRSCRTIGPTAKGQSYSRPRYTERSKSTLTWKRAIPYLGVTIPSAPVLFQLSRDLADGPLRNEGQTSPPIHLRYRIVMGWYKESLHLPQLAPNCGSSGRNR